MTRGMQLVPVQSALPSQHPHHSLYCATPSPRLPMETLRRPASRPARPPAGSCSRMWVTRT